MDYLTKKQQPQIDFQNNPILRSIVAPKVQYKQQENFSPAMNAALDTLSVAQQNSYDKQYMQARLNQYNQMSDSVDKNNNFISNLAQRQRELDQTQQLQSQQFDRNFDQRAQQFSATQRLQSQQFDKNFDQRAQQFDKEMNFKINGGAKKAPSVTDMIGRDKLFDSYYRGNYSEDELDYINDNKELLAQLRERYAKTGAFAPLEKYETRGWIGKNNAYRIAQSKENEPMKQSNMPQDAEYEAFEKWFESEKK